MKKWLPLILTVLFAGWIISTFRGPQDSPDEVPLKEFGKLPVSMHGRLQPLDSLARNSLLILRKKQQLNQEPWKGEFGKPKIVPAIHWMAELMMEPELADTRPCFRIDNADLKTFLNLPLEGSEAEKTDGKHFSWSQLEPRLDSLRVEATRAGQVASEVRSAYERAVLDLSESTSLYRSLRAAMGPAGGGELASTLTSYREKFEAGRNAFHNQMEGLPFDQSALEWAQVQINTPLLIPPHGENKEWSRTIQEVGTDDIASLHYSLPAYSSMASAWRKKDKDAFAAAVQDYRTKLDNEKSFDTILAKAGREQWFNHVEPFYRGMVISVVAFLLCILVWFSPRKFEWARLGAMSLMGLTFVVLTAGLVWRMFQEGRPPVTNLYSSALFIGWAATLLGLIIEIIWPLSVGISVSSIVSFATLLVAHFLSLDGDTMIMLRAVLDTNFWLATHVVIVTLGYAATFVSGIIGVVYVIRGVFSPYVTKEDQRAYAGMAFGIVCFAMLFSFVGTVLGGIWADQSWGRFWGWDPKENGALIIVIWNALILHARLGGMVKERGLLNLCIFGNIATSWSWFGTNMLGIGLHSYGFMDAAAYGLYGFMGLNALIIAFGCLPQRTWHSFASLSGREEAPPVQDSPPPAPTLAA